MVDGGQGPDITIKLGFPYLPQQELSFKEGKGSKRAEGSADIEWKLCIFAPVTKCEAKTTTNFTVN